MKPRLLVAAPRFGEVSEVWMRRQIQHMSAFEISILTWSLADDFDQSGEITVLDTLDWNSHARNGRWLRRAQNCFSFNFYGVTGQEKRLITNTIASIKPDVVLAHFGPTALKLLPITKRVKIPLIAHFHGYDLSSGLKNHWYRWSLQTQASKFYASIVVGEFQKTVLSTLGRDEKDIYCIPCGVPVSDFELKSPRKPEQPLEAKVRFISVGRLVKQKGFDIVLRAFARVLKTEANCELTIVGSGPELPRLRQLVQELGLDIHVRFTGAIQQLDVVRHMHDSDIYVQHSLPGTDGSIEGFGVAITEASASGLPVVATNTGGIPDQIVTGLNGFLVEPHDEHAMGQRMLELATNPATRGDMGLAGYRRAQEQFNTPTLAKRLERLMLEAVQGSTTVELNRLSNPPGPQS